MSLYQLLSVLDDNVFIVIIDSLGRSIHQASNKNVVPRSLYEYSVSKVSASFLGNNYNNVAIYIKIYK